MTARQSSSAAAAFYVALTFLLAYPLSVTADRTLPSDDPDGHLFMWTLAWDAHAFVHQPLSIFDANIFYPLRNSLALSENLIGSAIFAAPVLWMTGNPVLAVNVVSLLACVLCGLAAYTLGRRVGLSPAAAVLTGVIFAFSPPRFFRFSQLHLAAVQWIPFALASLHAYLDGGGKRDLRLAIGFFSLQVLASGHGGVFAAVAILLMLAYRLALGEPLLLGQRLRDFGLAGAFLLAPVALFLIPYRINQVQEGLRRSLDPTGTSIESFFASPTRVDIFLQSVVTDRDINGAAIAWLFPGVFPVLLALAAVVSGCGALLRSFKPFTAKDTKATKDKNDATEKYRPGLTFVSFVVKNTSPQYRAPLFLAAIVGLAWVTLGVTRPFLGAGDGLTARYYDNGTAVWTGYLTVDRTGRYNFAVGPDSPTRLSIDDALLIDHGVLSAPEAPTTGSIQLAPGSHRILLEIVERPGPQAFPGLSWARADDSSGYELVASWALSRRPVSAAAVRTVRIIERVRVISGTVAGLAVLWGVCAWLARHREAWVAWGAPYRRGPTGFYLLLTIVCIALAIGGRVGLWQYVYWLPGFNFIRGSSRFMVLGLLGVAVLAGMGFDRLSARLPPASRRVAAVAMVALLIAEFSPIPFRGVPYQLEIPAADLWVARQPRPLSIAEVPVTRSERLHSNYMLHSMAHWQKTVHGFSGIRPALHEELYDQLRSFPSEESVRHLAQLAVTHVIVHGSWFPPDERSLVEARLPAFSSWLKLEYMDRDSRVYSIHSPSKEEP